MWPSMSFVLLQNRVDKVAEPKNKLAIILMSGKSIYLSLLALITFSSSLLSFQGRNVDAI